MKPENAGTGLVVGQFGLGVADGADADLEPEVIPLEGIIVFTPSVPYLPNPTAAPNPITIVTAPITAVLDNEGFLCTPGPDGITPFYRGIRLFATDDPDLSVLDWTWSVVYRFQPVRGITPSIPAHAMALLEGETRDLATVVPVPSSPGIGTPQALALLEQAVAAAATSATDALAALAAAERAEQVAGATDTGVAILLDDPESITGALMDDKLEPKANAAAVAEALQDKADAADLAGKADLTGGKVPEAQIPDRLSETALSAAIDVRGQARHVKTFGAVGDGAADDTVALTAAIDSGLPLYWGDHRDKYRLTARLFSNSTTAPIKWTSDGATLFCDAPATIQYFVHIELRGHPFTTQGKLHIDANKKSHSGIYLVNNSETHVDANLLDIAVSNAHRASSVFTGGDGINLRGAFQNINIERPVVRDITMAPGAVVPGAQGVSGIVITAFNYLKAPRKVTILAPYIDGVYDEDMTSNIDQDGIKVFAAEDQVGVLTPYESSFNIIGGSIRNCGGRAVKSQMEWGTISGTKIYRGQDRVVGGPDIDFQVGGGKVTDVEFQYEGNVGSAMVNFSGPATAGKKVPHGSVSGIKAVITGAQTPEAIVTFNQRTSTKSKVTVSDVEIVGNQPSWVLRMNGVSGGNHSASISDIFAGPTDCCVSGGFGSPDGWVGQVLASNILNTGATSKPFFRSISGPLAAPVINKVNVVNFT